MRSEPLRFFAPPNQPHDGRMFVFEILEYAKGNVHGFPCGWNLVRRFRNFDLVSHVASGTKEELTELMQSLIAENLSYREQWGQEQREREQRWGREEREARKERAAQEKRERHDWLLKNKTPDPGLSRERCPCGGVNPNCAVCGGSGICRRS